MDTRDATKEFRKPSICSVAKGQDNKINIYMEEKRRLSWSYTPVSHSDLCSRLWKRKHNWMRRIFTFVSVRFRVSQYHRGTEATVSFWWSWDGCVWHPTRCMGLNRLSVPMASSSSWGDSPQSRLQMVRTESTTTLTFIADYGNKGNNIKRQCPFH